MRRSFVFPVLFLCFAGCTSISSTLLERDNFGIGWVQNDLKGVPITLKVPTHIRVNVIQREYICRTLGADEADTDQNRKLYLDGASAPFSSVNFLTQVVETEKVFTVDLPRPASGGLKYNAKFKDRYIDSIQSSANDDTIAQSSIALQRFITNVATGQSVAAQNVVTSGEFLSGSTTSNAGDRQPIPSASPSYVLNDRVADQVDGPSPGFLEDTEITVGTKKYSRTDSILCSRLFSLDDADVEAQIRDFMAQYSHGG